MARRRTRRKLSPRRTKPKHNWSNKLTRESRQRARFLDAGKENYFKYDAEEIMARNEVPEEHWGSVIQTMFTKGSRQGIEDAVEFADAKLEDGILNQGAHDDLIRLVKSMTRVR